MDVGEEVGESAVVEYTVVCLCILVEDNLKEEEKNVYICNNIVNGCHVSILVVMHPFTTAMDLF